MTYTEHLIQKAEGFWADNGRLPINLFYDMLEAGLDVETIERKYKEEQEQHGF